MGTSWEQWQDWLTQEIGTLGEGEFLNTYGPAVMRERGPGLLGRPRKPEVVEAGVVVRFLSSQGWLLAESVPAFPTRGERPVSDEQRRELSESGWLMPGDPDYNPVGGPDLRVLLPGAEPGRAAELAVRTYRILGCDDPARIEHDRGS